MREDDQELVQAADTTIKTDGDVAIEQTSGDDAADDAGDADDDGADEDDNDDEG